MKQISGVMAIVNVTPDSFYGGSRNATRSDIATSVAKALDAGAAIIDLGGYSTRPGAEDISPEEEFLRLDLGMSVVRGEFGEQVPVSIDTFRASVVSGIYDKWGDFAVNDISAGELDKAMIPLVGQLKLPYIAMHSKGTPQTMNSLNQYDDMVQEIHNFLENKIKECRENGITEVVIDPGFGFAKNVEQNFRLLAQLARFKDLEVPLLVGLSRKSMIWRTLQTDANQALNGTTALNWQALNSGADILRVHDVKEAVEVFKLFEKFRNC